MALNSVSSLSSTSQLKTTTVSCCTEFEVKKIRFEWTINNFSFLPEKNGQYLTSSTFSADHSENPKWCLLFYPRGCHNINQGYISVGLRMVSGPANVSAKFKISILKSQLWESGYNCSKSELNFNNLIKDEVISNFMALLCILNRGNGYLSNDKLTLCCEMSFLTDYVNIPNAVPIKVPECHLTEDLGQLLNGQILTDVILSAGGLELAAHKAILAARSTVFAAMFQHEMEEKRQNRVEISDMRQDVLREMLGYIYTGKVSNMTENMPKDLLVAADKYALDRLKAICEEHILSNLSVINAEEMLNVAQKHNADQLKARVSDFILKHATNGLETVEWRAMVLSNPRLVLEIFRALNTQKTLSTI